MKWFFAYHYIKRRYFLLIAFNSFIDGILVLKRYSAIFCKRLNACADFHHNSPFDCSECKIFACGKKLAHATKLVG